MCTGIEGAYVNRNYRQFSTGQLEIRKILCSHPLVQFPYTHNILINF
jgi:hypothetical protein